MFMLRVRIAHYLKWLDNYNSIPRTGRDLPLYHHIQTGCGALLVSGLMDNDASFPGNGSKADQSFQSGTKVKRRSRFFLLPISTSSWQDA
jgi:hypothetical protein